jgi:hypothetical protein
MKLRKPVETMKDPLVQILVCLEHETKRSAGTIPLSSGQLRSMAGNVEPWPFTYDMCWFPFLVMLCVPMIPFVDLRVCLRRVPYVNRALVRDEIYDREVFQAVLHHALSMQRWVETYFHTYC